MSTTIMSRGLHSCLKLQSFESVTLRLNLAPQRPQLPESITTVATPPCLSYPVSTGESSQSQAHDCIKNSDGNANTSNSEFGGWSFIESLRKETQENSETPYVHPLDKSSFSTLGKKSLEICTESLGSETGSEISDENDPYLSSSSDSETRKSPMRGRSRFCQFVRKKEVPRSFPPPLTSITGSDYVQCTPHRRDGRLVIKVISISTAKTCFEAERGDGRLRLHIKNSCSKSGTCSDEDTEDSEDK